MSSQPEMLGSWDDIGALRAQVALFAQQLQEVKVQMGQHLQMQQAAQQVVQELQMQQAAQQAAAQQQQAEMLRVMAVVDNLVGQQPRAAKGRTKPGRRERQRARELRAAASGEGAEEGTVGAEGLLSEAELEDLAMYAERPEDETEDESPPDQFHQKAGAASGLFCRAPVEVKQTPFPSVAAMKSTTLPAPKVEVKATHPSVEVARLVMPLHPVAEAHAVGPLSTADGHLSARERVDVGQPGTCWRNGVVPAQPAQLQAGAKEVAGSAPQVAALPAVGGHRTVVQGHAITTHHHR